MQKVTSINAKFTDLMNEQVEILQNKFNIDFESGKHLVQFLLENTIENVNNSSNIVEKTNKIAELHKIIEDLENKSKEIKENQIILDCNPDEYKSLQDLNDMCKIIKFSNDLKDLLFKLIKICNQRNELIITPEDYKLLEDYRNG